MRKLMLLGLLLVPALLLAQKPANDDEEDAAAATAEARHGFHFVFKDRPSFRFGESFKLDIKSKWHLDFRRFYPDVTNLADDSTFLLTRARIGIKGKATKY